MLEIWIEKFEAPKHGQPWQGNTSELYACLKNDTSTACLLSSCSVIYFGKLLSAALRANDCQWVQWKRHMTKGKVITIHKPSLVLKQAA